MSIYDVEAALNSQIEAFRDAYSIKISWENVSFNPRGHTFVRVLLEDSRTTLVDLSNSYLRITGTYKLIVYAVPDVGKRDTADIIRRLQTQYFKRGTTIEHNGTQVRITNFRVLMANMTPEWYVTPLVIEFRSDIPDE